jgi:hypothetical protein
MRTGEESSYRVALSSGVLDGFAGDLVDQGECRVSFLVLDAGAVPHVLDPVLEVIPWVGRCEAHGAVPDGEAVPVAGLAVDAHGGLGRQRTGQVAVPVPARHRGAVAAILGAILQRRRRRVAPSRVATVAGLAAGGGGGYAPARWLPPPGYGYP